MNKNLEINRPQMILGCGKMTLMSKINVAREAELENNEHFQVVLVEKVKIQIMN